MPQKLLHLVKRDPSLDKKTCEGMSQRMKMESAVKSRPSHNSPEMGTHMVRVCRTSPLSFEYQPLSFSQLTQHTHRS